MSDDQAKFIWGASGGGTVFLMICLLRWPKLGFHVVVARLIGFALVGGALVLGTCQSNHHTDQFVMGAMWPYFAPALITAVSARLVGVDPEVLALGKSLGLP